MTDEALVSGGRRLYGRLSARPVRVNPLEFSGLRRPGRWLRLKEWIGFTLIHPELYCSMIIQDAHYLASSEIYIHEREQGILYQHAAHARGGSVSPPQILYASHIGFERGPGYRIAYDFAPDATGSHRIRADIAPTPSAPRFELDLQLHGEEASAPLAVSSELPGHGNAMFAHKALFPVSGTIRVGSTRQYRFEPGRDLAIIDEHKSHLPYRSSWMWGTFGKITETGPVGANLCARAELPDQESESCIWSPGRAEPLDGVSFTKIGDGALAPWTIASEDGRVDLTFEPEGRKDVKHQLVLASIDYFQLFGRYRGTLVTETGSLTLNDLPGVCESMRARM